MRVYVDALGCKLNQSEMENLGRQFLMAGHQLVSDVVTADLVIFNTCTVTHIAARKSRQALRKLRRANPSAFVVATGCYVQMSPGEIRAIEGIDMLVDNGAKDHLYELLSSRFPGLLTTTPTHAATDALPLVGGSAHTRAFIKIQDGCDNACSYCIVTQARGAATSRAEGDILAEIQARLDEGYRELVLTGVHIGSYGQGSNTDLAQLVRRILAESAVPRLRLSSIEPWDFSDALLGCWQDARLCRQIHLPLQSGCDATLQRMGRKYTTAAYAALLQRVRAAIPDLAVTTDIIVGFPQETEAEFQATLDFVAAQDFARLHVFAYSLREGTEAAAMPGQVDPQTKEARSQRMRALGQLAARRFQERALGKVYDVLWETGVETLADGTTLWSGLTDNYLRVMAASPRDLHNVIAPVELTQLDQGRLWGRLLSQDT